MIVYLSGTWQNVTVATAEGVTCSYSKAMSSEENVDLQLAAINLILPVLAVLFFSKWCLAGSLSWISSRPLTQPANSLSPGEFAVAFSPKVLRAQVRVGRATVTP